MTCRHLEHLALAGIFLLGASSANADINLARFNDGAMLSSPEIVECTLKTGATAECAQFLVKYKPDYLQIGPFCPQTLDETGGIWAWDGENAGLYRLDRAFFEMLSALGFDFSDQGKSVNISDPSAGRPTSDHTCLEAAEDTSVEMTVLIPVTPQRAESFCEQLCHDCRARNRFCQW